MDYTSSVLMHTLRAVRVDRDTMSETATIETIQPGGTLDYNDLTTLKVTGNLPYTDSLDIGNDFLRIWLDTEEMATGELESLALGTFLVSTPTTTLSSSRAYGTADLYSVLQLLIGGTFRDFAAIPDGTRAVDYAAGIVRSAGLPVVAVASSAALSVPMVIKPGTSRIEVVNDLLRIAGYDTAEVDGYGNVLLSPYSDPTGTHPVAVLDTGLRSVLLPEAEHDMDDFDVPNVIVAVVDNDAVHMRAVAVNDDPANRFSTASKRMEITERVEVSDISSKKALQDYADSVLQSKTTAVESIHVSHAFIPYNTGDTVRVALPQIDITGSVASRSLTLDKDMMVESRVRRFVRY